MNIALVVLFAVLFAGAHFLAVKTVLKYWRQAKMGQPEEINTSMGTRIKSVIVNVLLQKKLMKRPVRGLFHVFIFYGFLVYGLHTGSQFIGGFIGNFEVAGTRGYDLYIPAIVDNIIPGFEFIYDYILDIFTLLVLSGLAFFGLRRWVAKAPELDRPSAQSAIVIFMIGMLMVFTLIGEPAKAIRDSVSADHMSPIRAGLVSLYESWGVNSANADTFFLLGWWGHVVIVFSFMVYVPRSKHAHLIWAPVNFFFQKGTPKGAIPFLDTENAPVWGATAVQDFTWKNHLDGLSCIECGRCTIECPANRTGKALDPKKIMTDLKHSLMEKMDVFEEAKKAGKSDEELMADPELRVIDNYTTQEELWACTTCYACVEACPVGNNQVDAILSMRRALVLNEGQLPGELSGALANIENQSNPWGVGAHKREEWAEGLDIKTMAEYKEAGEEPDILFWVGCAGAFDDRNKKIVQSFAKIMQKADVKFGILGQEENCTGDSARRAGNEYLYQMLADTNIQTMNGYGVKKIVTTCPHCFNTLQNEYPQMGGEYDVQHHTTYLNNLLSENKLNVDKTKAEELGKMTYHDSCYLGRYNNNYDAPREVLSKTSGSNVLEPVDNKVNGLCCGAGGAQMWKEEEEGSDRVNLKRSDQLMATEAKTIASACPFCITMVSDGVKTREKEESVKTLDVAEIVEKTLA